MSSTFHATADATADTTADSSSESGGTRVLRNLYLARFGFAICWAVVFAIAAPSINPVSAILLIGYPLVDVAAAVVDFRSAQAGRPKALLTVNMALSLAAAVGLGVAVASGIPAVLRVWGAWAITAGLVQLIVGIARRGVAGHWPMILSGGISVLAGTGFVTQAAGTDPSITSLAGYATLGGIFFLVSAIRLHRIAR